MKRYLLNTIIVFYLAVIYFSGVPETNTLNTRLKKHADHVALILGIWPSWSMFAPNPVRFDTKTYVEIVFKDGKVKELDVETEPSGIPAPFRRARWMKYSQDNLRSPTQAGLWHPAIRHFHAKFYTETNPITKIKLKRKWAELGPLNEHARIPTLTSTPRFEKSEEIITQTY